MGDQDAGNPGTAFQQADQIVTPKRDFITRLGTALNEGHKGSAMDQALQAHNQRRVDEAQMHHATAATAAGALLYDNQMLQKVMSAVPNFNTLPLDQQEAAKRQYANGYVFLSPEERQSYNNQHETAMDNYEKIVGVDKNTKAALQRSRAIIGHLTKYPGGGQGQVQAGNGQGNLTPPPAAPGAATPQAAGSSAPFGQRGDAGLTPPPQPPGASPGAPQNPNLPPDSAVQDQSGVGNTTSSAEGVSPADAKILSYRRFQSVAPFVRQQIVAQMEDNRALKMYKDKEEFFYDLKIKEDAAKAKAKSAAHPTRPAPGMYTTSVLDARQRSENSGEVYTGFDGNPIDLYKVPETMGLKGMLIYNTDTDAWDLRYTTWSPNQTTVTIGKDQFVISPMDKSKLVQGKGQEIGPKDTPTTTRTTDPTTGQTTVSVRTPTITGMPGRPVNGGAGATPQGKAAAPAQVTPGPASRATFPQAGGVKAQAAVPLDETGHIQPGWAGAAPQVIEGANQLKDGMDMKDIGGTSKSKPLAEALARQAFGWSRDKFTPIEHTQIALASRYIGEAINSPSLKSLDKSFFQQLPMIGASGDPSKEGTFMKGLTKLSAMATTPAQREFLRLYRQMAGTISGLGKLSRGGRITEATVNRLLRELPDPSNTSDSKDAIQRLMRFKDEVDSALSHDSYQELSTGRSGAASSGASSVDDEIMKAVRDAKGKP